MNTTTAGERTRSERHHDTERSEQFLRDVLQGLRQSPPTLPCKYFYDFRGSQLFEQICQLPEYYPTRTELRIMHQYADQMGAALGSAAMLIELGSGSSQKTRELLEHLPDPVAYVPVDVSATFLHKTAEQLRADFPSVEILPVVADFTRGFPLPEPQRPPQRKSFYFPGSTIGNLEEAEVDSLLEQIATAVGPGGGLLIGIDLHKDVATLEAAYNDAQGVTADFNKNLLHHINRELDADFSVDDFAHRATYNSDRHRIEMSLVCQRDQEVTIDDAVFAFAAGDEILTEYSHKYDLDEFAAVAARAGFQLQQTWTDDDQLFAVLYLVVANQ